MFEIGYIPKGWKRGNKLMVWPVRKQGDTGSIMERTLSPIGEFDPYGIAAIQFRFDDAAKAQLWVDWFQQEDLQR